MQESEAQRSVDAVQWDLNATNREQTAAFFQYTTLLTPVS